MPHVKGYKAGASLRMWRDYFPKAVICGIDISQKAANEASDGSVLTYAFDSRELIESSPFRYDLIVDDGSHNPDDQIFTWQNASRFLNDGGLYIIEDVERYALEQNLLSPHLPEHTVIQHHHGKEVGRCILIRG